jgi:hypothetical protein
MSEVLNAGAKREIDRRKRSDSEAIGKRRKINRSEDELELGRFVGDGGAKARAEDAEAGPRRKLKPASKPEVVGPKRRDPEHAGARSKRQKAAELEIAAPMTVDEETAPAARPRARRRSRRLGGGQLVDRRELALLALAGAIMVLLTAATFLLAPRYQMIGEPILADPAFEGGLAAWRQEGNVAVDPSDPGRIILESDDPDERTHLWRAFASPPGGALLVLRARAKGDDVVPGPEIWDRARIYLVQLDAEGRPDWSEDHRLFDLQGTTEVQNYAKAFAIPADVESVRLGIEIKDATGRLTVSGLSLAMVERKGSFLILAGGLFLIWGALTLRVAVKTYRGIKSAAIRRWLGIAIVMSLAGLMAPGALHDGAADFMADRFGVDVDSLGHGLIFAILALLVRLGRPDDPLWIHIGAWLLISVASEALQLFTFSRESSVDDLVFDAVGVALGLALAEIARRMRQSSAA